MNRFLPAALFSLLILSCTPRPSEPIRVLAVGNSFSMDAIEQNLWEIANSAGVDMVVGNLYIGGCSLERHLENLRTDAPAYRYRKIVGGVMTETEPCRLSEAFGDEKWTNVSLQQVSGLSGEYDTYETVPEVIRLVREYVPGAKLMWHSTWAYQGDSDHGDFPRYGSDQMTMYRAIISAGKRVMADNKALKVFIPAGTAVQNARASSLGDSLTRDGYHLELTYGRYTAALTWFESLTGIDSRAVTWKPEDVTEDVAVICRVCAHNAVANPFDVTVWDQIPGIGTNE